jgi:hypothetical protein
MSWLYSSDFSSSFATPLISELDFDSDTACKTSRDFGSLALIGGDISIFKEEEEEE